MTEIVKPPRACLPNKLQDNKRARFAEALVHGQLGQQIRAGVAAARRL